MTGWSQPVTAPASCLVSSLTLGQWPSEVAKQETHTLGMNEPNKILVLLTEEEAVLAKDRQLASASTWPENNKTSASRGHSGLSQSHLAREPNIPLKFM